MYEDDILNKNLLIFKELNPKHPIKDKNIVIKFICNNYKLKQNFTYIYILH